MTTCSFLVLRRGTRCQHCTNRLPRDYDAPPIVECRQNMGPGLGDYTERMLASIGVTKEHYVEAKSLFGMVPSCWCPDRQDWINRVGDWVREKLTGEQ